MKQLSLFEDNKDKIKYVRNNSKDYAEFLEKFKEPKTTDDCFTPPCVYDAVLDYVKNRYGLGDEVEIVRPFYPGGDFENYEYPENCVVVDNPPFSIFAKIVTFFTERKIPFFLFANHLTLFNNNTEGVQFVVCGVSVKYDNGAIVSTSFLTNMNSDKSEVILMAGDLARRIRIAQKMGKAKVKVIPNPNLMNSARITKFVTGSDYTISAEHLVKVKNKKLFGGGFVIDDVTVEMLDRKKAEEIPEEIPEEIKLTIKKLNDK